jgi:hypothetical protein
VKTSLYSVDREATAEELFSTSGDETMCLLRSPATAVHSMDYQWYELPSEEFVSLMAVCAASAQN